MTSSYKHRFARAFHQISRENPDLPVGRRFAMANLQIREARLTALIAELQSYRGPIDPRFAATPALAVPLGSSCGPGITAVGPVLPDTSSLLGEVPSQAQRQPLAIDLIQQPMLG